MKDFTDELDNEIGLKDLLQILWNRFFLISSLTVLAALISIIYSLSLPNFYTSSALLAPTSQDEKLSSTLGGYSGIAGLAGINMTQNATKSQEALERIKSYEFFRNFFLPKIKFYNLMAVEKWIPENNVLVYQEDLYDIKNGRWTSDNVKPSNQIAFKAYRKMLFIQTFKDTGFVSLSIEHQSPIIAKKWMDIIIFNINESMRELDKLDAENAISYLNESSKSVNILSIREVIARLLENQMQTLMLASSNDAYIFRIIDSPIVSENKSGPSRALVCILGTFLGLILSVLLVLIIHFQSIFRK
jgi:LPS O-antigen subunit length determinant protein (WzzB/FepE family)